MKLWNLIAGGAAAAMLAAAPLSFAQDNSGARPGYDVPYVPTPQEVVNTMLKTANVGPGDYVIDLGSGDGRIVLTAVQQHGARGFGVDLNPDHIARSTEAARRAGIAERATFANANLFDTDFSKATVLTMYLLPEINLKLRSRLLSELKPGTRIVSHDFDMGEWQPDQQIKIGAGRTHTVYYWVIPAQVAGTWNISTKPGGSPVQLSFTQQFQKIAGKAQVGDNTAPLQDALLNGNRLSFTLVSSDEKGRQIPMRFEGHVDGNNINGTVTVDNASDRVVQWQATKS